MKSITIVYALAALFCTILCMVHADPKGVLLFLFCFQSLLACNYLLQRVNKNKDVLSELIDIVKGINANLIDKAKHDLEEIRKEYKDL